MQRIERLCLYLFGVWRDEGGMKERTPSVIQFIYRPHDHKTQEKEIQGLEDLKEPRSKPVKKIFNVPGTRGSRSPLPLPVLNRSAAAAEAVPSSRPEVDRRLPIFAFADPEGIRFSLCRSGREWDCAAPVSNSSILDF